MVLTLLGATFAVSLAVALLIVVLFRKPIAAIMNRLVPEALSSAWTRYMSLAVIVVGVSGGVQVWKLEQYLTPTRDQPPIVLNADRWVLEVYRTVIGTAQAVTWLLLVFFAFALIAYVIVRRGEMRAAPPGGV